MLPMEAEMKLFYNRGCFLVVFLAVFLVACDGGPLKPSPPDNGGNGEGNGLETDSVPMLLRLKDADGQDTKMWVEVLEINPAPGSKIRVSSGCINPADCFRARVKLGFDGEVVIAYLEAFFSNDEVNPDGPHVFQRSQAQGSTEISLDRGSLRVRISFWFLGGGILPSAVPVVCRGRREGRFSGLTIYSKPAILGRLVGHLGRRGSILLRPFTFLQKILC